MTARDRVAAASLRRNASAWTPRKLKRDRWIEIVKAAHRIGLSSTSTLMYGHIESARQVANHLNLLRDIQKQTGGFTEFVPLGFIHERNALFNQLQARPGPHSMARLRAATTRRVCPTNRRASCWTSLTGRLT